MMILNFLYLLLIYNRLFANSNISFKYTILPITYYNDKKYVETAFKLAKFWI